MIKNALGSPLFSTRVPHMLETRINLLKLIIMGVATGNKGYQQNVGVEKDFIKSFINILSEFLREAISLRNERIFTPCLPHKQRPIEELNWPTSGQ